MPISYRSAADLATEYIRDLIHSGKLEPGTRIAIDELTADMQLSSTPVRDALKRLESEGLVEIVARVGVYVRRIPPAEVIEVYGVKQALEPILVYWAVQRGSKEDLQAFAESAGRLADLAGKGEVEAYVELVEQRRASLFKMAGSDVLRACFQAIDGRVRWLRHQNLVQPGRMAQSIAEHRGVAEAVAARDAERAADLTARHVGSATRSLVALMGEMLEGDPPHDPVPGWRRVKDLLEPSL